MAMNSFTVFAGTDGWTARMMGARAIIATDTNAPAGSKGSFARTATVPGYEEVVLSSVYPSGAAFATISAPIMPLAPGRLSTMTLRPHASPSDFATARVNRSDEPPATYGITIVTFFAG